MAYEKVRELMESLKLTGMMNSLDFSLHNWGKGEKDVTEVLEELLLAEVKEKSERRYLTALKYSGLPFHKTLEEFDFSFQPSIDRKQIMELKSLRFLYEKRMSFCLDLPGLEKHIWQ
jgi:DNA replication protein DnaC